MTLNRLDELLIPFKTNQMVLVAAITQAVARRRHSPQIVQQESVKQIQIERIKQAQDEDSWISNIKIYLSWDVFTITSADVKSCDLISPDYEVNQDKLLLFCPRSATKSQDHVELVRLVIPELLQQNFCIITILAWKEATRVLVKLISGPGQSFTGEVYRKVFNGIYVRVCGL